MIDNRKSIVLKVQAQEGVLETIGSTPLIRLRRYLGSPDVALYAKMECYNPGGSAKDRPARTMIEAGFNTGEINSETTIIESSSGNMGIGLAQVCRFYGLPFICVVDIRAQPQNIAIMKALGAEIEMVTEPLEGDFLKARLTKVKSLLETIPDSFWPNQYGNRHNPEAHENGTIKEIDEALNGQLDYLFVATSSTGTIRGCRDYLRKRGRKTKIVAVDAMGSILFGGKPGERRIPGLGAGDVPELAEGQQFDAVRRVSELDCVAGCWRMVQKEAMLVGGSAGGVLETVRAMKHELHDKICAVILHDSGTRYLDTIFSQEWVKNKLGYTESEVQQRLESNLCIDCGLRDRGFEFHPPQYSDLSQF